VRARRLRHPAVLIAAASIAATGALALIPAPGPTGPATVPRALPGGRTYSMHLPPPSTSASPRPLLVALHGPDLTAAQMEALTGLSGYADAHRLAVAYSDTASPGDAGYVLAVIRDAAVAGPVLIDRARVYVLASASAAALAWHAACDPGARVAAAVVVAGASYGGCCPPGRVRVYHAHGAAGPASWPDGATPAAVGWLLAGPPR